MNYLGFKFILSIGSIYKIALLFKKKTYLMYVHEIEGITKNYMYICVLKNV